MINREEMAMIIVGNSGEARSLAFEAMAEAKKANFNIAKELLMKSKEASLKAHTVQTELICAEADGEKIEMNLLLVHAQDHLMTSILARELAEEIINLHEKIN